MQTKTIYSDQYDYNRKYFEKSEKTEAVIELWGRGLDTRVFFFCPYSESLSIRTIAIFRIKKKVNLPVRSTGSLYMKANQMPDELKRFGGPDEEEDDDLVTEETE